MPIPNDLTEIHEDLLYAGSENPLVLSRFYTVHLECVFELKAYPFDKQRCPIILEVPLALQTQMSIQMGEEPTSDELHSLSYNFIGLNASTKRDEHQYLVTKETNVVRIEINMVRYVGILFKNFKQQFQSVRNAT